MGVDIGQAFLESGIFPDENPSFPIDGDYELLITDVRIEVTPMGVRWVPTYLDIESEKSFIGNALVYEGVNKVPFGKYLKSFELPFSNTPEEVADSLIGISFLGTICNRDGKPYLEPEEIIVKGRSETVKQPEEPEPTYIKNNHSAVATEKIMRTALESYVDLLQRGKGLTKEDLADLWKIKPNSAYFRAKQLESAGLVKIEKVGRGLIYSPVEVFDFSAIQPRQR